MGWGFMLALEIEHYLNILDEIVILFVKHCDVTF